MRSMGGIVVDALRQEPLQLGLFQERGGQVLLAGGE